MENRFLLDEYGDVCFEPADHSVLNFGTPVGVWLQKIPTNDWDPNGSELSDFLEKKKLIYKSVWETFISSYKDNKKYQSFLKEYKSTGDEPFVLEHFRIDLKNVQCGCPIDYLFVFKIKFKSVVISKRDPLPLYGSRVYEIPLPIHILDQADFMKRKAREKLTEEFQEFKANL